MAEPFLGEIRLAAFNFAPVGWALCEGQLLPIVQYTALFALLGTFYGGDGVQTFALPDLRGRVPIGFGQGPGLSQYVQGETGGVETVTLAVTQMPAHGHYVHASAKNGTKVSPVGNYPAVDATGTAAQFNQNPTGEMNPAMITQTGGNLPHENRQPFLTLNWIIALQGIFPSRP